MAKKVITILMFLITVMGMAFAGGETEWYGNSENVEQYSPKEGTPVKVYVSDNVHVEGYKYPVKLKGRYKLVLNLACDADAPSGMRMWLSVKPGQGELVYIHEDNLDMDFYEKNFSAPWTRHKYLGENVLGTYAGFDLDGDQVLSFTFHNFLSIDTENLIINKDAQTVVQALNGGDTVKVLGGTFSGAPHLHC